MVGGTTPGGLEGEGTTRPIVHARACPGTSKTRPYCVDVAADRLARAADSCSNVGSGNGG